MLVSLQTHKVKQVTSTTDPCVFDTDCWDWDYYSKVNFESND